MKRRGMNKMVAVDELAIFVSNQTENWSSLVEHLRNGGDPDRHFLFAACTFSGKMNDFKAAVVANHPEINTSEKYDRWHNFNDDSEY